MANVQDIKNSTETLTVIDSSMNIKINTGKALQDDSGNTIINSDGDLILNLGCYLKDNAGNQIINYNGDIKKVGATLLMTIDDAVNRGCLNICNSLEISNAVGIKLNSISVLYYDIGVITLENINKITAEKVDVTDDIRIANGHDLKLYSDNFSSLTCAIDGNTGNINTIGSIVATGNVTAGQILTDELNLSSTNSFIYVLANNATALKIVSNEPAITHLTIDTLNLRNISNQDFEISSGKNLILGNDLNMSSAGGHQILLAENDSQTLSVTDGNQVYFMIDSTIGYKCFEMHIKTLYQNDSSILDCYGEVTTKYLQIINSAATGTAGLKVNDVAIIDGDGIVNAAVIEDKFLRNDGADTTIGNLTIDKTKPAIIFDGGQASDTKYWMGDMDDNGNDDDDLFKIGKGITPDSNVLVTLDKNGKLIATSLQGDHYSSDGSQGMSDTLVMGEITQMVVKDGLIISVS